MRQGRAHPNVFDGTLSRAWGDATWPTAGEAAAFEVLGNTSCVAALLGHAHRLLGALELGDGRCLSWSARATLRIWDTNAGALLTTLTGHTALVPGGSCFRGRASSIGRTTTRCDSKMLVASPCKRTQGTDHNITRVPPTHAKPRALRSRHEPPSPSQGPHNPSRSRAHRPQPGHRPILGGSSKSPPGFGFTAPSPRPPRSTLRVAREHVARTATREAPTVARGSRRDRGAASR